MLADLAKSGNQCFPDFARCCKSLVAEVPTHPPPLFLVVKVLYFRRHFLGCGYFGPKWSLPIHVWRSLPGLHASAGPLALCGARLAVVLLFCQAFLFFLRSFFVSAPRCADQPFLSLFPSCAWARFCSEPAGPLVLPSSLPHPPAPPVPCC